MQCVLSDKICDVSMNNLVNWRLRIETSKDKSLQTSDITGI
jgi:hypothetical protein